MAKPNYVHGQCQVCHDIISSLLAAVFAESKTCLMLLSSEVVMISG